MSELSFAGFSRPDGMHLSVNGIGSPFAFWLGDGKVGQIPMPNTHLWTVEGPAGHYTVQLTVAPLDPAALASMEPLQLLAGHFHWETGFQKQHAGSTADEKSLAAYTHGLGMPVLSWISDRPPPPSEEPMAVPATTFSTMATLVHDGHVLGYALTGMGATWQRAGLQQLALKIVLSYERIEMPKRGTP